MTKQQRNLAIVLASTSPRRQQLLSLAGINFTTLAVEIDESLRTNESAQVYIQRMVEAKSDNACRQLAQNANQKLHHSVHNLATPYRIVITADTIGVLPDGVSILLKPIDKADAFAMWHNMSANTHSVWTAVCLRMVDNKARVIEQQTILEKTAVTFVPLTLQMMERYWQSLEPQDKAGGYAIQGKGAAWVERINGSYTNVVGLPLAQTLTAIDTLTALIHKSTTQHFYSKE